MTTCYNCSYRAIEPWIQLFHVVNINIKKTSGLWAGTVPYMGNFIINIHACITNVLIPYSPLYHLIHDHSGQDFLSSRIVLGKGWSDEILSRYFHGRVCGSFPNPIICMSCERFDNMTERENLIRKLCLDRCKFDFRPTKIYQASKVSLGFRWYFFHNQVSYAR